MVFAASGADLPRSPFEVKTAWLARGSNPVIRVSFTVPPEHVLYADRLKFEMDDGAVLAPTTTPAPSLSIDKVTGKEKKLFERAFVADLKPGTNPVAVLMVKFQGCSNSACYFPDKRIFRPTEAGTFAEQTTPAPDSEEMKAGPGNTSAGWQVMAEDFKVVARETGYLSGSDFLAFLDNAAKAEGSAEADPLARFKKLGAVATIFLIMLGGAALNLTPCVLPLIPINLAIIGAGSSAQSRRHGFWHGGIYGAGMALVYGGLGLVAVLTGSKFGTLNSSIWFNVAIALVFVVLSLGMFDVFHLDFARFSNGVGRMESDSSNGSKSRSLVAFTLGAVAALLAGACVAPVVISVLLLSTSLYSKGMMTGLALPFLLGVGMALPWPFAGAGLACLPKPGRWMIRVKQGFGVLILLFAFYYGHLAFGLARTSHLTRLDGITAGQGSAAPGSEDSLRLGFARAKNEHRPLLIDFQASWCKNCEAMEETVFSQNRVQSRLKDFVVVKYQAERPNQSPAREVLDRFGVLGLPTYVVLKSTEK